MKLFLAFHSLGIRRDFSCQIVYTVGHGDNWSVSWTRPLPTNYGCFLLEAWFSLKGQNEAYYYITIGKGLKFAYWRFFRDTPTDLHVSKRANTYGSKTTRDHPLWWRCGDQPAHSEVTTRRWDSIWDLGGFQICFIAGSFDNPEKKKKGSMGKLDDALAPYWKHLSENSQLVNNEHLPCVFFLLFVFIVLRQLSSL